MSDRLRSKPARVVVVLALAASLLVPAAGTAQAQYPIDGAQDCIRLFNQFGQRTTTFELGGTIRVIVLTVCRVTGQVIGFLEPGGQLFSFSGDASGDRAFDSGQTRLPRGLSPGRHRVVVETEKGTFVQPIQISSRSERLARFRGFLDNFRQLQGFFGGGFSYDTGSSEDSSDDRRSGSDAESPRLGTLHARLLSAVSSYPSGSSDTGATQTERSSSPSRSSAPASSSGPSSGSSPGSFSGFLLFSFSP